MPLTDYLEEQLLTHMFLAASYTMPHVYVALSLDSLQKTTTSFAEPTDTLYERREIMSNGTRWTITDTVCANNVAVIFPALAANTTVAAIALVDQLENFGHILCYQNVEDIVIPAGKEPKFSVGAIEIVLEGTC